MAMCLLAGFCDLLAHLNPAKKQMRPFESPVSKGHFFLGFLGGLRWRLLAAIQEMWAEM
jgi:hypothetical protein